MRRAMRSVTAREDGGTSLSYGIVLVLACIALAVLTILILTGDLL